MPDKSNIAATTPSSAEPTQLVGSLRLLGLDPSVSLPALEPLLTAELLRVPDKVESFVKVDPANYLLYLKNQSEDEAQFEANFISGDIRAAIAARVQPNPEFHVRTVVLRMPLMTLASAIGTPEKLQTLIEQRWEEKKAREKAEAEAAAKRASAAPAIALQTGRPRSEWKKITYVSDDIDNSLSRMTSEEIDRLPFGVIKINRSGTILQFNAKEAELTTLAPKNIIGRNFFRDIAPCTNRREFLGRFADGVKNGNLDVTFNYLFDFRMRPRHVKVHLKKSYHDDNYWILVEMNDVAPPDGR